MKKGYLEFDLLVLLAYFSLNQQFTMARHAHHHRTQNSNDCYRCPPGYGVERHCNRMHDTECGACEPDHYSSHFSARRPCYPCSRCGTGLYVAHKCTASRDTVCDSCNTYRGPHNEDFYERCVRPRLDILGDGGNGVHSQDGVAKEKSESLVAAEHRTGVHSSVVIASSLVIGALAAILLTTCLVITTRKQCRRGNHRYPYVAVATKEAVML